MRGQIAKESPTFIRRSDMQREHKNGDKSDPPGRKVEFDQRKGKGLVSKCISIMLWANSEAESRICIPWHPPRAPPRLSKWNGTVAAAGLNTERRRRRRRRRPGLPPAFHRHSHLRGHKKDQGKRANLSRH